MEASSTSRHYAHAGAIAAWPNQYRAPSAVYAYHQGQFNHVPQNGHLNQQLNYNQPASSLFTLPEWGPTAVAPVGPYDPAGSSHLAYAGTPGGGPPLWTRMRTEGFSETGSTFPQQPAPQYPLKTRRAWGMPDPAVSFQPPTAPQFQQAPPQFYYTYPQPALPALAPYPQPPSYLPQHPSRFPPPPQFLGNNYHRTHRAPVPPLQPQAQAKVPILPSPTPLSRAYTYSASATTNSTHPRTISDHIMLPATPAQCEICGVLTQNSDAPPGSIHEETWQHKLGKHCNANQLATPVYKLVSDRRGGRTAWSASVYTTGYDDKARYWYSGHYNAREDAAEVLFKRLSARTPPTSPGSAAQGSPQLSRRMSAAPYNSPSSSGSMSPTTNYTYSHAPAQQQQGQQYQPGQPQQYMSHGRAGSGGQQYNAPRGQDYGYYPKSPQSGYITQPY